MVLYYVMVMGGSYLGQRGQWPPWLAIWLGNIVLVAGSIGFFWRFTRQMKILDRYLVRAF